MSEVQLEVLSSAVMSYAPKTPSDRSRQGFVEERKDESTIQIEILDGQNIRAEDSLIKYEREIDEIHKMSLTSFVRVEEHVNYAI
jgi:hypothetical protein